MRKDLTELVFILDRSGSMGGLEQDTIGGFNSMLQKQKTQEGEVLVTTVLFDDQQQILHDRVPIKEVAEMTQKEYYVRGCTALLDAVGDTITHIRKMRKEMPKEERPEKTIFMITTDGQENSSQKYTYEKVKKMIEKRQAKNWEFIFLGANIDAIAEAARMGIKSSRAANYVCDGSGTALNYSVLNDTVAMLRSCPSAMVMSEMMDDQDCFAEIREDYDKRKKA